MADDISSSNFPPNSHKARQEREEKKRPKLEKVIDGEVGKRKKSLGRRIGESFSGDDARTVGSYLLFDVIVPAAKNMISEAVSQGIERMLFGGEARRIRPSSGTKTYTPHTPYNRIYTGATRSDLDRPGAPREQRSISSGARRTHDFQEIFLENRSDAQEVLDKLTFTVEEYDLATVEDLYDLVGIQAEYTDKKWGWDDLTAARVERVRDGYILNLPPTKPID